MFLSGDGMHSYSIERFWSNWKIAFFSHTQRTNGIKRCFQVIKSSDMAGLCLKDNEEEP